MATDLEKIEAFLVYEVGICPTNDNHFGGNPEAQAQLNLKIQQRPAELANLIYFLFNRKAAGEKLDYYAEIGACSGGTTFSINKFLNFKELLIIDDGGAEAVHYINARGNQLISQNLGTIPRIEIIGSSAEQRVIDMSKHIASKQLYDILFIDGDHSYEGVKNDTINYLSIVRSGGYVIFHDTNHIKGIMDWMQEIPSRVPELEFVNKFSFKDSYTDRFPTGIGITIFRKS